MLRNLPNPFHSAVLIALISFHTSILPKKCFDETLRCGVEGTDVSLVFCQGAQWLRTIEILVEGNLAANFRDRKIYPCIGNLRTNLTLEIVVDVFLYANLLRVAQVAVAVIFHIVAISVGIIAIVGETFFRNRESEHQLVYLLRT